MKQIVNEIYKPLFTSEPNIRYIFLLGGRGRGGSTVASQFALAKLISPDWFRCAIMRFILSDIRNSIYREIKDRAEEQEILDSLHIEDNTMTIEHDKNSITAHGFRKSSGDQRAKLKSLASYNCVIIEEGEEVPEEDFMQLDDSLRTVKGDIKIIIVLNPPPKNHWIIKRWFKLLPSEQQGFYDYELKPGIQDAILIKGTYEDNIKNIASQTIERYEAYRELKPNHYWNMIRGLVPETVQGKIYNNWKIIDEIPHEARLERRGLDFGYTNDPTALIDAYYYNGGWILDEAIYQKGMSNQQIGDTIKALPDPHLLIKADSAEPKSIDELKMYGLNVVPVIKGQDSVIQGIQYAQNQRISVTKRSVHLIEEYENYSWKIDKDTGEPLNEPIDMWNHGLDAVRYLFDDLRLNDTDEELPDDTKMFDGDGFY